MTESDVIYKEDNQAVYGSCICVRTFAIANLSIVSESGSARRALAPLLSMFMLYSGLPSTIQYICR